MLVIDIKVENNTDWVSLNTLSGYAVGTGLEVQNKWFIWAILNESATKPSIDDYTGKVITSLGEYENNKVIEAGSLEIWVRAYKPNNTFTLNLQEV